tara:strand:- start:4823 stop:6127 length:1305 start_codon:yes stop_codon:yes gene_type:complete
MNKHEKIFNSYLNEENILITGPGGTGKTFAIKRIYKHAIENNKKIAVTALTGVASILLDCAATTIHSWSGIGLGNKSETTIVNKILNSQFYKYNWLNTDILVIDEISMMSSNIFDLLNNLGQIIRKNTKPFGGLQIILSGDFFQLPPIDKDSLFCFESKNFDKSFDTIIKLTKIFRQSDIIYKNILLNMRKGLITKKTIELLKSKIILENSDINKSPDIVRLVPTKNKANNINEYFLNSIKDKKYIYKRSYKETSDNLNEEQKNKLNIMSDEEKESEYNFIKKSTLTNEKLILKKGAYVMCIANLNLALGIANGTTGKVIDFTSENYPIVEFSNNSKIIVKKKEWKSNNVPGISVNQVPLILAWGITIHKAQGITLDKAIVDVGNDLFEAGQMYVALSRLKTINELYLLDFNIDKLKINLKVLNYYNKLDKLIV